MIYYEIKDLKPLITVEEPTAAAMQKFEQDTSKLVFLRNKNGLWDLYRKKDIYTKEKCAHQMINI